MEDPRRNILGEASPDDEKIIDHLQVQRNIAADVSRPLEERLEAYEDILVKGWFVTVH